MLSIEEKKSLLIEMEKWYRIKYQKKGRIGEISRDLLFPFFEEKNNFKHEPKHCRVCNKKLEGKYHRYCSDDCREMIHMFSWERVKTLFSSISHDFSCRFCGVSEGDIEVDHIKPICKGGLEFDLGNLRYLCQHCNRSRKLKHRMVEPPKEVSLKTLYERQKTLKDV